MSGLYTVSYYVKLAHEQKVGISFFEKAPFVITIKLYGSSANVIKAKEIIERSRPISIGFEYELISAWHKRIIYSVTELLFLIKRRIKI